VPSSSLSPTNPESINAFKGTKNGLCSQINVQVTNETPENMKRGMGKESREGSE